MLLFGYRGRARREPWSRALAGQVQPTRAKHGREPGTRRAASGACPHQRSFSSTAPSETLRAGAPCSTSSTVTSTRFSRRASPLRGVAADAAYLGGGHRPARRARRARRPFVQRLRDHRRRRLGQGRRPRVRGRLRARRGRVDHRPAGALPVARDGQLPPADGRCPMGASSCRSTRSASTTSSAPTCPTTEAAFMAHAQRPLSATAFEEPAAAAAWRDEAVLGACSAPQTSRSLPSCTASPTSAPARR